MFGGGAVDLSLRFDDKETGHNDLVLRFAGQSWVCDSYYLALDRGLLADREDADKVRAVLRRLLMQWLEAVDNMPDGGAVFLPYDFSDQYTAWLRCQRSGSGVTVFRGWADMAGWSCFPSAVGEYLSHLPGFRPDGPSIWIDRSELLQAIRTSLADAAEPGPTVDRPRE
jgi:hypothetical protein